MRTNHVTLLATLPWRMLLRPSKAWPVLLLCWATSWLSRLEYLFCSTWGCRGPAMHQVFAA